MVIGKLKVASAGELFELVKGFIEGGQFNNHR